MPQQEESPHGQTRANEAARKVCEDLTRLHLLYLSQPTQDRLDKLMTHCLKALERNVGYYVRSKGFCPSSLAPSTFVRDAFSRADWQFRAGIHALRSSQALAAWIKKIALSGVVDELRHVVRRMKNGSCAWEPLEIKHPDGTVTNVFDRAENRDAAKRYGCVTLGQTEILKELVHSDILGNLFANAAGSKRERDGIKLLKMMLTQDLTAEEIAAQRGMKKTEVSRLLCSARKRLRKIAETQFNFTAEDL